MKNIFYDLEFQEEPGSIEIISIGAIDDEGNEFYEVSSEYDESQASPWLKENVLPSLGDQERITNKKIAAKFLDFVGKDKVNLWGYYSAYDHVCLMWLYGIMNDKPEQLPYFTYDLKQILDKKNLQALDAPEGEHNALVDAKWNLDLWKHLGSPIPEVSVEKEDRVFLGGTCNGSDWRNKLEDLVKDFDLFNPVVDDWTEEAQEEERKQREICSHTLFVITPKMKGTFSIAEVVEDSIKRPSATLFCPLLEDGDLKFDKDQFKSLIEVAKMVERNGGKVFSSLEAVANFINNIKKEKQ